MTSTFDFDSEIEIPIYDKISSSVEFVVPNIFVDEPIVVRRIDGERVLYSICVADAFSSKTIWSTAYEKNQSAKSFVSAAFSSITDSKYFISNSFYTIEQTRQFISQTFTSTDSQKSMYNKSFATIDAQKQIIAYSITDIETSKDLICVGCERIQGSVEIVVPNIFTDEPIVIRRIDGSKELYTHSVAFEDSEVQIASVTFDIYDSAKYIHNVCFEEIHTTVSVQTTAYDYLFSSKDIYEHSFSEISDSRTLWFASSIDIL
jgi:hypothetical protein